MRSGRGCCNSVSVSGEGTGRINVVQRTTGAWQTVTNGRVLVVILLDDRGAACTHPFLTLPHLTYIGHGNE